MMPVKQKGCLPTLVNWFGIFIMLLALSGLVYGIFFLLNDIWPLNIKRVLYFVIVYPILDFPYLLMLFFGYPFTSAFPALQFTSQGIHIKGLLTSHRFAWDDKIKVRKFLILNIYWLRIKKKRKLYQNPVMNILAYIFFMLPFSAWEFISSETLFQEFQSYFDKMPHDPSGNIIIKKLFFQESR